MDQCFPSQRRGDVIDTARDQGHEINSRACDDGSFHAEHEEWVIIAIVRCIDGKGHGRILLKADQEPATKAFQSACLLGKGQRNQAEMGDRANRCWGTPKEVTVHQMELSRMPCETPKG